MTNYCLSFKFISKSRTLPRFGASERFKSEQCFEYPKDAFRVRRNFLRTQETRQIRLCETTQKLHFTVGMMEGKFGGWGVKFSIFMLTCKTQFWSYKQVTNMLLFHFDSIKHIRTISKPVE